VNPEPLAKLKAVWRQSTVDRTRIAAYIESRGLSASVLDDMVDDALRFHASLEYWDHNDDGDPVLLGHFPAMVARVRVRRVIRHGKPEGMKVGVPRARFRTAPERMREGCDRTNRWTDAPAVVR